MLEKHNVFILSRYKFSEADLFLKALNQNGERLIFFIKNGLKSRKRCSPGTLEPSNYLEVVLQKRSPPKGVPSLKEAKLLKSFHDIRTSYDKMQILFHILESTYKVAQENNSCPNLFNLLGNSLNGLIKLQGESSPSGLDFLLQFNLKLLYYQGVLERRPWMKIYLQSRMGSVPPLIVDKNVRSSYLQFAEERLKTYLKRGEVHHDLEGGSA